MVCSRRLAFASAVSTLLLSTGAYAGGGEAPEEIESCTVFFKRMRAIETATLPGISGSTDNVPRSLPRTKQNRLLYGIEAEYSLQEFNFGDDVAPRAGDTPGVGRLFSFYRSETGNYSKSMQHPELERRDLASSDLTDEDRWLAAYLPEKTHRERGKVSTQEIATEILPNRATFEKLIDGIDSRIGPGSYQAMISIPHATLEKLGRAEIVGFTLFANELASLASIAKPREFHPFLHPYNSPLKNFGRRADRLRREYAQYFREPGYRTDLRALDLSNPKYTIGIAPRFDLASTYGGARFFFEIRGCKTNRECVKRLLAQTTHVFENEVTGFARFADLSDLLNGEPWKMAPLWMQVEEAKRTLYSNRLEKALTLFSHNEDWISHGIETNFLYPLRDWASLARVLELDAPAVARLARAQAQYLESLDTLLTRETPNAARVVEVLSPALAKFTQESGLYEHFQNLWRRTTGKTWDVEF
jgi:hypothetical protein